MKILLVATIAAALTGCGAEVATTAAASAAIKKQEVEAGQQTKAMAQKKIDEAAEAAQKRAEQVDNAYK